MLLAVDVGNTNTVLGLFTGEELVRSWRITTHARATGDEMALTFRGLLDEQPEITGLVLCSTVPSVLHELRPMLSSFFHEIPVVIVEPGTKTGVPILTDNPKEVGADRIVNAVAAVERWGYPIVVVDFGTATTFDVVDHDGAYIGGVIAPGVNLSLQALHQMAAALPHVDIAKPKEVIGKNTVSCMQSGVFWGYIGLVKEICRKIKEEKKEAMRVVATGGLAPLLQSTEKLFENVEENLTMQGLRLIFDYNKSLES